MSRYGVSKQMYAIDHATNSFAGNCNLSIRVPNLVAFVEYHIVPIMSVKLVLIISNSLERCDEDAI